MRVNLWERISRKDICGKDICGKDICGKDICVNYADNIARLCTLVHIPTFSNDTNRT